LIYTYLFSIYYLTDPEPLPHMPEAPIMSHNTRLSAPATARILEARQISPKQNWLCPHHYSSRPQRQKRAPSTLQLPKPRDSSQIWLSTAKRPRSSSSEKVRGSKLPRALNIFTKTIDYRHRPVARQEPGSLEHQRMYRSPGNNQEHTRSLRR